MNAASFVPLAVLLVGLALLAPPLGAHLAAVCAGQCPARGPLLRLERLLLRGAGVALDERGSGREQGWLAYAAGLLAVQAVGFVLFYALQRLQTVLPLDPNGLPAVPPELACNTAMSFVTNTNWQAYAGETTLSHSSQMLGATVQNFVSAATGLAAAAALARGFARQQAAAVGNVYQDLVRIVVHVLLPLAVVVALALVACGVVQTFAGSTVVERLDPVMAADGTAVRTQVLPLGPVASQVAIKQLGTNGGGFFGANSAHPFENPNGLSGWIELLAILLLPAACCFQFGAMVGDRRQGWALCAAMALLFVPAAAAVVAQETAPPAGFAALGVDATPSPAQSGGNMEGKEARFGAGGSALWAAATAAASNGSVDALHESFTALGGAVPLVLILLGEVVFGGVGSGLYGMVLFALLAVFLAGLMVGRTPEYLGKKVGPFELQMTAVALLLPSLCVLVGTAVALTCAAGRVPIHAAGARGLTEVLYAFASTADNNGSAFAGLDAATPFYTRSLAVCMFVGRYGVLVPTLAIAGSLVRRRKVATTAGTLPTSGPLFVVLLAVVVVVVGALTFLPALALGPLAEHLQAASR